MKVRYLLLFGIVIPLIAGQVSLVEEPVSEVSDIMPVPQVVARGETLAYDDGNFTGSLGITTSGSPGTPAPDETYGFATYFILSDFGITQGTRKAGQIMIRTGPVYGSDFRVYIWDNIAGTLQPNSHGTHLYSDMTAPLPPSGTWQSYDVSSYNIIIPETTWVSVCYNFLNTSPADWYLAYCGAVVDEHTFGNLSGTAGQWQTFGAMGYPQYDRAYGIRLVLEDTGGVVVHNVGVQEVTSPPEGTVAAGDYDVIGRVRNYGTETETFDVTADVYDTTGGAWTNIFNQTVTLTDFPSGGDSLVNFGMVNFADDSYFYTEIYTLLAGDEDPSDDTASVYSQTTMALGDIVFEMDVAAITGYSSHLGVEFDGAYFYVTSVTPSNVIHVIDTLGNLLWSIPQGTSTPWGMRDLAWDGVYAGPDRIDTLYASDDVGTYQFGIDLASGTMDVYTPFTNPPGVLPCRALGWDDDDGWFFTANWDPLYKFQKDGTVIQGPVAGPGSLYGSAYDTDDLEGHYIWWHGQTGPYSAHLTQMNPSDMTFTGVTLDIPHSVSGGIAGGLCFYEGFRDMDVLFAIIQPSHIYGLYVRDDVGVEEQPTVGTPLVFGFAPNMANPVRNRSAIPYATTTAGKVSLKVYDSVGKLVETLVNSTEPAGVKTANWNIKNMPNGVYFLKLEAEGKAATQKLIVVR